MINISPVPVGYPAVEANGIEIRILPFQTNATTCSTYYELINVTEIPSEIEGEEPTVSKIRLAEGNYILTEEEYSNWGDDNVVVENAVLSNLKLTRA